MNYYPLTSPQQNIWNLQKYYEQTSIGNISGMITLKSDGITDLSPALSYAINRLIKNADALRLRFTMLDGEVKQYFADYIYEDIPVWNYSHMTEEEVLACLQAEAEIPFDLNKENSMVRFAIVKRQDSYSVFMSIHHLICDGWTANLIGNWLGIYAAQYDNQDLQTAPIPSYAEFIKSEEQYRHGNRYERDTAYWETFVKEYREPSYIKPKLPENDDIRSARYTYHLSREETTRIKAFCLENNCSPDALMKTAVAIYLNKLNHDPHIVIGTPLLNRLGTREKAMLGMCVNSLPLSIHINDEQNPQELLCQYGEDSGILYRHIRYPLLDIQNLFRSQQKDTNRMYDVLVSYEYTAINESNIADVKWFYQGCSEIPLTIHVDDRGGNNCFDITYDYQLHLFNEKKEIELLACRIRFIIEQMLMGSTVGKISILPCDEKQLLQFFNNTSVPYPKEKCLHELFEKTVAENANTVAVVFENHSYTYAELNQMANSIAYELRRLGVTRNDIVPIIARRSHLVLAAQFGVIKAGGAYLPIDPDYPQDRIDYMLDDAKCKVALIYQAPNPIEIDSVIDLANLSINENLTNPQNINNPSDLCYVIYTSGSTGKPKGTMLTHRNAVNFCHSNKFNVCEKVIDKEVKRFLSITTIGFDMYVTESLLALTQGLTVYFANDKQSKSQNELSKFVIKHDIEVLETTPTKLKMLMSNPNQLTYLKHLKRIILGGEPFSRALYNELSHNTNARIFNLYGPTETTVWSSINEVVGEDFSVGSPTANTQIYILDELGSICPIGVAGELCISGDGVCQGYLNREELTAEKFIDNPFGDGKLYKTGDLALYRPDGKLEHLGRIDTQVKIRGLRVELGEIESNICAFDGVTNAAVVIVNYDVKDFLCAFYQSLMETDEFEMKASLSKVIPSYMVPNLFIRLNSLPMTSSGKIARGVLTKYDISGLIEAEEYKAPETELQKMLCKEFEGLLKISPVSINLDFFGAGGNSIHVIEMLAHLPEEFHLSAKDIYDNPTVESLALHIEHSGKESSNQILDAKKQTHRYPKLVMKSLKTTNCCLFTGATGYLGSHLLMEYLTNSDGKAYCIVRGTDITESRQRLIDTMNFYFGEQLVKSVITRIVIVCGDITQLELGLSNELYQRLINEIEAVYHSAADVRHFTRYEDSYAVNVLGTRNMIDLCKAASATLHHMSTISVSGIGMCSQTQENIIFNEQSFDIGQNYSENTYIHTKYLAEDIIYDAVEKGLSASIYRLGNISERHSDGVFQKNSDSNAFYIREMAIKKLNAISEFFRNVLIDKSYVDECATAIFALSKRSSCGVYHISNPNLVSLYDYFVKKYPEIRVIDNDAFLKLLSEAAKTDSPCAILQVYLNMMLNSSKHHMEVSCWNTVDILKTEYSFEWSK